MEVRMKKRWICLFVENEIGTLARIAGLFSGKSYNLDSLTVGETEDRTISRMTISLTSDDMTFEQVKKQLNRAVEVIKVVDYTDIPIYIREVLFIKVFHCNEADKVELFRIAEVFGLTIADYDKNTILLECTHSEAKNNDVIKLLDKFFCNRLEIVRSGGVAIESISLTS
ncbi:MAG TPA: acetolactate synthase small subunit [Clostridiales bacterium]|nr:acetolactate synthase small subunit [Clostridiales bacterium]